MLSEAKHLAADVSGFWNLREARLPVGLLGRILRSDKSELRMTPNVMR